MGCKIPQRQYAIRSIFLLNNLPPRKIMIPSSSSLKEISPTQEEPIKKDMRINKL
tara:strand:+ start:2102 stop:2266 length:165 start_codon:yes stop_codon:yes gene_type:complete